MFENLLIQLEKINKSLTNIEYAVINLRCRDVNSHMYKTVTIYKSKLLQSCECGAYRLLELD